MATSFSSLPIIDLSQLDSPSQSVHTLSQQLHDVFATTGFAYLVHAPLSFSPDEVFALAREFFQLPHEQKMRLAKRSFRPENQNTYRGYFPTQPSKNTDNLKEGFEIGPPHSSPRRPQSQSHPPSKIVLSEPNVWPDAFPARKSLEKLHCELQTLASTLLSLLALSLDKPADFFASYLTNSLSTLRLLHYPIVCDEDDANRSDNGEGTENKVQLSCTPHTDSGILTLLHQDATGGLEVRDASGRWVAAPYIPGSIVVNIGDLMARVSGGRFVATMHRVRKPRGGKRGDALGRLSVPFFFEPGEDCVVRAVDGDDEGVLYGEHVRAKMSTWVEFMDVEDI